MSKNMETMCTRKSLKNGDIKTEKEEQAKRSDHTKHSSSVTTTGLDTKGSFQAETVISVVNSGYNNTYKIGLPQSSPKRLECIEFNTTECVHTFTGREEFIKSLHDKFSKNQPINNTIRSKCIVICGMAGVGKTQVARKYIQTYKELYDHVIWINAERDSDATSCFLRLAVKFSIHISHSGKQKDIFDDVYDVICRKRVLIVYDNVGSYYPEDGKGGLQRLLPSAVRNGWKVPSIIVTTRNRNWQGFIVKDLKGFELSNTLTFFSKLDLEESKETLELLEEILNLYQGLPLMLQQVLSYILKKREACTALGETYSLRDFIKEVNLNRGKVISTKPADSDYEYPDVYTMFDMIFADIASLKYGQIALQCLDVMAMLNPDFVPTVLLRHFFKNFEPELEEGLSLLQKYHLVTRGKNYYQIHRIVQNAKIELNKNQSFLTSMVQKYWTGLLRTIGVSTETYVPLGFEEIVTSLSVFLEEIPIKSEHLHEILSSSVRIHDQASEKNSGIYQKFGKILASKLKDVGNYTAGIKILEDVIQSQTGILGPYHQQTLRTKHNLALLLKNQGKYNEAQVLYHEVLQMQTKILRAHNPETLKTKHSIAIVFKNQGEYNTAENLFVEILKIQSETLGLDNPDTLRTKHNLAGVFLEQGKYDSAQKLYNDVLEMKTKTLGTDHPGTLRTKHNLARVFLRQRKFSCAHALLKEVLEVQLKELAPNHPETLHTKHSLAAVLKHQSHYSAAEKLYNEVLEIQVEKLGPAHPSTLNTKHNLAAVFRYLGKCKDAQELYEEVLKIQMKTLGPNYPGTVRTRNNLASVFENHGK